MAWGKLHSTFIGRAEEDTITKERLVSKGFSQQELDDYVSRGLLTYNSEKNVYGITPKAKQEIWK